MPASSVDQINITNVVLAGGTVKIDRYSFDIEVNWTDLQGGKHNHMDTYIWPNVLADIPNNMLRRFMEGIVVASVRVTLGLDDWKDYG